MPDALASIPLSALRIFEAAARLGSFTRAASKMRRALSGMLARASGISSPYA